MFYDKETNPKILDLPEGEAYPTEYKKRHVWIWITAIVIIVTAICIYRNLPRVKIERELEIKLPSDAEIIKYSRNNGSIDAKIAFGEEMSQEVKDRLNDSFGYPDEVDLQHIPYFSNTCAWWDLNNENIDYCYSRSESKSTIIPLGRHGIEKWVLITKVKNGQFFMYIST